jgi:hypothetical protein
VKKGRIVGNGGKVVIVEVTVLFPLVTVTTDAELLMVVVVVK